MKLVLLATVPLLTFCAELNAQNSVTPPIGSEILLDGKCLEDEWIDAKTIASREGHSLRVKRSERYLYMCITYPENSSGTFEGYLISEKQPVPFNIHVSAKIGGRQWQGNGWPEWNWWETQGWWSTPARYNSFREGERRFLRNPAREIQFDLEHFGHSGWKIMFDVYAGRNPDGTSRMVGLPAGATFAEQDSWMTLRL